jgi:TetR/AcrR family hemagglutinin/protease transcriptional regulator
MIAPDKKNRIVPAARTRTRRSRASREAQLLGCAILAFADQGISRATHANVAQKAQVSVPTVFAYFPTREALVDAVLKQVDQYFVSLVMAGAASTTSSARDRLISMILRCVDSQKTHLEYICVLLDWSTSLRDPVWQRYLAFFDRIIAAFDSVLQDGKRDGSVSKNLDTNEAARIIVGETHMISMMLFAGFSRDRLSSFVGHYVDAALNFIPKK